MGSLQISKIKSGNHAFGYLGLIFICALVAFGISCGGTESQPNMSTETPPSDTVGGDPAALPAKIFLDVAATTQDLPFEPLTLWSANRFLDERGVLAVLIRPALAGNFEQFISRPDLSNEDVLMLEVLFTSAADADGDLSFTLAGNDARLQLHTNLINKPFTPTDIAPMAWVRVADSDAPTGDLGWLEEDFDASGITFHNAGEQLTLEPGETARVWLPFVVENGLERANVSLTAYHPIDEKTNIALN